MGSGAERRLALREKECAEVFGACAAHATGRFSATFVDEHSQAESQIILGECERERGSFCRCSCSHSFVNLNNNDNNHKKKKKSKDIITRKRFSYFLLLRLLQRSSVLNRAKGVIYDALACQ